MALNTLKCNHLMPLRVKGLNGNTSLTVTFYPFGVFAIANPSVVCNLSVVCDVRAPF